MGVSGSQRGPTDLQSFHILDFCILQLFFVDIFEVILNVGRNQSLLIGGLYGFLWGSAPVNDPSSQLLEILNSLLPVQASSEGNFQECRCQVSPRRRESFGQGLDIPYMKANCIHLIQSSESMQLFFRSYIELEAYPMSMIF